MIGTMHVLDEHGDTKICWDSDNADSVAAARRTFDDLRAKGHLAHSVKESGEPGEIVTRFDPKAEKLILTPPLAGG